MRTNQKHKKRSADQSAAPTNQSQLLQQARHDAGLTMDQLADLAGVHKSLVSRLESGARDISRSEFGAVSRLCAALGLSVAMSVKLDITPGTADERM